MVFPQFATVSYEIPIDLTQVIFRKKPFLDGYSFLANQYFATQIVVSFMSSLAVYFRCWSSTSISPCFRATKLQRAVRFPLKMYCKPSKSAIIWKTFVSGQKEDKY